MPSNTDAAFDQLQEKIVYRFSDVALLKLAFRHKSAGKPNNERLEFLGDAILNAVVAELLYLQHGSTSEGKMTTARSQLVKGATLSQVGADLDFAALLELGQGERKSADTVKQSILEDAVEALIGAVYLDGGFDCSKAVVGCLLGDRIDELLHTGTHKDAKTQLQELMQAEKTALPRYELIKVEGPAHQRHFTVSCCIDLTEEQVLGQAPSRRAAEQQAAENMLKILDKR